MALADGLSAFRAQDRYFKLQAALVAGWLAVSVTTVAAVALGGPSEGNHLGAQVRADLAIGGPVLLVMNGGSTAWTDVTYRLNGDYVYRQATLAPGDHATLPVGRFRKGGAAGKRAPRDLEPRRLEISCEEGQALLPIDRMVKNE